MTGIGGITENTIQKHWMQDREIELQALITERSGYEAENAQRDRTNSSPAYGGDHFQELAQSIRNLMQPKPSAATQYKEEKLVALLIAVEDVACIEGRKASMGGIDDTRILHIPSRDWEDLQRALKEYQEAAK